jgi:hypothetical protein
MEEWNVEDPPLEEWINGRGGSNADIGLILYIFSTTL